MELRTDPLLAPECWWAGVLRTRAALHAWAQADDQTWGWQSLWGKMGAGGCGGAKQTPVSTDRGLRSLPLRAGSGQPAWGWLGCAPWVFSGCASLWVTR